MAPITKELDVNAAAQPNAVTPVGVKQQPAAAEIPVTVNGARTLEGTDKREPFSEATQTVLVFANGAVIRLSSPVASGQLLFLTNEKTKKEVVCQVVRSKDYASVSGYVELEFTEAAPGFWGMRFPSNSPTTTPNAVKSVATNPAPTTASLQGKIAETKTKPAEPSLSAVSKPSENAQPHIIKQSEPPLQPLSASPTASSKESIAVSNFPAQLLTAPAPASKIPTLSEFLTQGAKGPQLKTKTDGSDRTPTEDLQGSKKQAAKIQKENVADKGTVEVKQKTEQQKSLTSLLMPSAKQDNPAPGSSTFDFETEEVKIPAWLEPLARNSTAHSSTQEIKPSAVCQPATKAVDSETSSAESAEPAVSGSDSNAFRHFETSSPEPRGNSEANEAALTLGGDGRAPNFGSSLALDSRRVEVDSQASGNGLKLGLLAASLLLAAGGVWFIYSSQPKRVSASGTGTVPDSFSSPSVASPVSPENAKSASPALPENSDVSRRTANLPATRVEAKPSATYGISSSEASPSGRALSKSSPTETNFEQPVSGVKDPEQPAKKPAALGRVHLAPPVANSRLSTSGNTAAMVEPDLNSGVTGGDATNLSLLGSKSSQPSAPTPVGGDVRPARLLSSVAPVYPQLARSQRLSGDVKIDALVDAQGRVSTMKVVGGPALLHQAAMDAVRQWKYQPAMLNGQPTAMHLTVTVQFRLQ